MLIDFSVRNYLSFREEVTLSLLASNSSLKEATSHCILDVENGKHKLLPVSIIYGPNASGKSNLIKGFRDFRNMVLHSHKFDLDEPIPFYKPFRLDENSKNEATEFTVEFVMSGVRYVYNVAFQKYHVIKEELSFYPKGKVAKLFKREEDKFSFGSSFEGEKKAISNNLLKNTLFLSKAANSAHEQMGELYRFFRTNFKLHLDMDSSDKPFHITTKQLLDSPAGFKSSLLSFLNAADFNISDIRIDKDPLASERLAFPDDMPVDVRQTFIDKFANKPMIGHPVYRDNNKIDVQYFALEDEESTGTLKIYDLAGTILRSLSEGRVLLIDEFNSGLHSHIGKMVIELFTDPSVNKHNAQLIVVTHDTCTMDSDNILREEIWFTNKNGAGATELFSLDEFDKNVVRRDSNYSRLYHDGRFQAVPTVKSFRHEFLEGLNAKKS